MVSVIDYKGRLLFDTTKPDGTPRKLLDVGASDRARAGYRKSRCRAGIESTYAWFEEHLSEADSRYAVNGCSGAALIINLN